MCFLAKSLLPLQLQIKSESCLLLLLIARGDRQFSCNGFTGGFIKLGILEQDRLYRRVQSVSDRGDAAEQGSNDSSPGKNIVVGLVFQHNQNCVKGFFQELQSKRIFRVGGGYIVSAWVILQVAAIVFPSLELPSWTMKVVLDVLLLGFAPALLLGWHLDLRRGRAERSSLLKKDVAGDPQSPSELGEGKTGLDAKRPAMQTAPRGETPDTRRGLAALSAGVAALLILAAAGGWYVLGGRLIKPAQAAHLSVVVLPFTNLSGDPSQDYFAEGVTENLTTDLSRIRNSFVIARNTAFTYKGKAIDAKAIGKELGVRYVLEGSVQRDQNRVRANAQLIDAESGAHIWADRFEEDMADLFKLQDQVVAQLANALRYELGMAEAEKGARAQDPDAIDLAMRGWAVMPRAFPNKEQVDAARPLFEQALKIDPDNSEALAGKALTATFEYIYAPKADTDYDAAILGSADRAIAFDRGNIHAYQAKGQYLAISGRPEDAVHVYDAGLAINPNAAVLLALRSTPKDYLGRFEQAKSDVQQAMVLSPRDPAMGQWFNFRADAELGLGRYDEALEDSKRALEGGHRVFYTYLNLAAAHAFKGEMDEAKADMAEARRNKPDLSVKWLLKHKPVLQFAFDGLRKAGLPEE